MPPLLQVALSNAVMASVLALVAAAVTHFVRRPALAHGLWLLVLLKLLTPPIIPLHVSWPASEIRAAVESRCPRGNCGRRFRGSLEKTLRKNNHSWAWPVDFPLAGWFMLMAWVDVGECLSLSAHPAPCSNSAREPSG